MDTLHFDFNYIAGVLPVSTDGSQAWQYLPQDQECAVRIAGTSVPNPRPQPPNK